VKQIRDLILEENTRGKTFFLSSHLLSEIEKTCHRVGIISRGVLVAEDTIKGIKDKFVNSYDLEVELEWCPPGIKGLFQDLTFVKSSETHGRFLRIQTKDKEDHRATISRFLTEHGVVVLNINKKELSLEEAFITITEKNVTLLVGKGVEV
jgi:ABC-type multidrug transport system ATPase subunit